jgi:DnaJ family protein C protein 28
MSNIEEHIRRAMEQGEFDDLPGKGRPLNLDENPLEDPDWRLAHHMLRSGGFTLPWIETYREIEKEMDDARQSLVRAWAWRQAAQSGGHAPEEIESEWQLALERFRQQIQSLNERISSYNMGVPTEVFLKPLLNADREITRLTTQTLSDKL